GWGDRDRGQSRECDRRRVRGTARAHESARPSGVARPRPHAMTAATSPKRTRIAPTRPVGGAQARAERTRALIMDETVRCVVEEGFAAASAKHIAERAGVTWGVIQYHFGDRDGLLAAVVESGFDELRARMATVG